jgi:photosystem II stability/assembly factor-like uncharacterized protein
MILFLATTFQSDSPPGWYQQVIPRNDVTIQDIFFQDSLTGHIVTRKNTNDSAFIFKTTDGGNNWILTLSQNIYLTSIQFASNGTGYSVGSAPGGIIKKTTDNGLNWFTINTIAPYPLLDLYFVNPDTGWVCSDDPFSGGIFKTTDGGNNWQSQLGASFFIKKLFFLNKDSGWALSNEANSRLYITTNGGQVWSLRFTFSVNPWSIYFTSKDTGYTGGFKTTNGGFNWSPMTNYQGRQVYFTNGNTGWNGGVFSTVQKTIDGQNWFNQTTPIFNNSSIIFEDTMTGWAGGNGLVHTTDGGGPPVGIEQISNEVPLFYALHQNYPNPFNPVTNIMYSIMPNVKGQMTNVKLVIYNVQGQETEVLVDQRQSAGTYKVDFDATGLPSGVYFYSLYADGKIVDTKKMLMVK